MSTWKNVSEERIRLDGQHQTLTPILRHLMFDAAMLGILAFSAVCCWLAYRWAEGAGASGDAVS